MDLIEFVPNVSEGRNRAGVDALVAVACGGVGAAGAALLDVHVDPDHNRSVLTLAGDGGVLAARAAALAMACLEHIDVGSHAGAHPRLGSLDVCPFVPLAAPLEAARAAAGQAARSIGDLGVPVFLYDLASPAKRTLPEVRRHAFGKIAPDFGPPRPHPTAGATAVGVRGLLVAYNIDLATGDPSVARRVASRVRESNGGPRGLRALALVLESQRRVQVSMNLTSPAVTGVGGAWRAVESAARLEGVRLVAGELVGLVPEVALADADQEILDRSGITPERMLERALAAAGFR